ncbi:MAG TPA: hypothetical protein VHQ46_02735 [Desulfobacteria bacterium]|nr:hypothetical protein [Desulfobacteria bacterium]
MSIRNRLQLAWDKFKAWNGRLKPLRRLYLALLLVLGFAQGIISIIVLLLGPDKPVGSR